MGKFRPILIAVVVLAIVGLVYVLMGSHTKPVPEPQPTLPAQATPPQTAISGNYADDWQSRCGPLTGDAQAGCTDSLDKAYGRKAATPVPGY
jgi:hypothetical protein